mgnify:CR=1 FL=1
MKLKHRRRSRSDAKGFSLVEVMIAITFLGIGLLAVAQFIPLGMAGITQARVRTNAVQAAQLRLDDLKSEDFSSAALTAGLYRKFHGFGWDPDPSPFYGAGQGEGVGGQSEGAAGERGGLLAWMTGSGLRG